MPALRILHVLNYGWPHIDGYTVRSQGLITAQKRHLGFDVAVAVSPFAPLTQAQDPAFTTEVWGPNAQIHARHYDATEAHEAEERAEEKGGRGLRRWERPELGFAPLTAEVFRSELGSIIQRLEPDLVHAHHPHYVGAPAYRVARARGVPFVYELRCFNGDYHLDSRNPYFLLRGTWQNILECRLCRTAPTVVTIADGLAARMAEGGTPEARIHVVRNSVNADRFASKASPRRTPGAAETLTVGYATTFGKIENLDALVRAAAQARGPLEARGRPLRIVIAGTGSDWERIRDLVRTLGLEDTVELPGFVPYGQMPDFYRRLDLFVVPRGAAAVAEDTTPLKPLEALAAGVPLLTSDLPALRELLGGKPSVRFAEPTAPALAAALLRFAEDPWPGRAEDVADRTWAREVHRYADVYEAALQAHTAHASTGRPAAHVLGPSLRAAKTGVRRAARATVDCGLPGLHPLKKHVVVCGFPRAGSTLLQIMVECCVRDVRTFPQEVDALWAARAALRNHPYMLTKMPRDVQSVEALRTLYAGQAADVHFVLTLRDPRDVLTSTHDAYPASQGYYVSCERWQAVYNRLRSLQASADVTVVHYEDLVTRPGEIQEILERAVGWSAEHPFADFYRIAQEEHVTRDSMTEGALGGLRPLDPSKLGRWKKPEHRDRLRAVLRALPDLPDALVALDYEPDRAWVGALDVTSSPSTP